MPFIFLVCASKTQIQNSCLSNTPRFSRSRGTPRFRLTRYVITSHFALAFTLGASELAINGAEGPGRRGWTSWDSEYGVAGAAFPDVDCHALLATVVSSGREKAAAALLLP